MNAQFIENLFIDSYMMMNFEITFSGVKDWFSMADMTFTDVELFRALLFPEHQDTSLQFSYAVVYRHEDMFFQANRFGDTNEPIHQLLLRMMNVKTIQGEQNALIDLGLELHQDKNSINPKYSTLHHFFEKKFA